MRIACLLVPELPLQALRRIAPELAEAPLAVAAGPTPRDPLIAVSAEAAALGLKPGITVAQARHLAPDADVRPAPAATVEAASAALADVALGHSPRVRRGPPGELLLDASGLSGRWGSDDALAAALLRACRRVGLTALAGVASTTGVARVAALAGPRRGADLLVVPAGHELGFLAPLPLALLGPSPPLAAALRRWGLTSAGELARLPRAELAPRLGEEGVRLHRLAWGEELEPFIPDPVEDGLREAVLVEHPVTTLEPFLFLLHRALSRLAERLRLRGAGFEDVTLELQLEGGGRHQVRLRLVAPTTEVPAVLALARLQLEAHPPGAPVDGIAVEARAGRVRLTQGALFGPPMPAPAKLATVLARLGALVGPDRLGAPAVPDTHRPGAWTLAPFAPRPLDPVPEARPSGPRPPVLRAFRPAREARVVTAGGRPVAARSDSLGGAVLACAGPYRSSGDWWADRPFARDDYDVATADGSLLRLSLDRRTGTWQIDGVYD